MIGVVEYGAVRGGGSARGRRGGRHILEDESVADGGNTELGAPFGIQYFHGEMRVMNYWF